MNTAGAGRASPTPNLHEMGGEKRRVDCRAQLERDGPPTPRRPSAPGALVISPEQILQTAKDIGEPSVLNHGRRADLWPLVSPRVLKNMPMADMGFWYHFGILGLKRWFILTALDAGTRAGHALCCRICWATSAVPQENRPRWWSAHYRHRGLRRPSGYLLYQGVVDLLAA